MPKTAPYFAFSRESAKLHPKSARFLISRAVVTSKLMSQAPVRRQPGFCLPPSLPFSPNPTAGRMPFHH